MYMLKSMKLIPNVIPEENTFKTFKDCTDRLRDIAPTL